MKGIAGAILIAVGWLSACAPEDHTLPECERPGQRQLSALGGISRVLRPGQHSVLKVVLVERCQGTVAGAEVRFEVQGDPGDSILSDDRTVTEADGAARVVLTAGQPAGPFMVRAWTPDDPEGVVFGISARAPVRELQPLTYPTLALIPGETRELLVRVQDPATGQPSQGLELEFTLEASTGDASLSAGRATTSLGGLSFVTFLAGSEETTYRVRVAGLTEALGEVVFEIEVLQAEACSFHSDCPQGHACRSGHCEPAGEGSDCDTDDECPAGYRCWFGVSVRPTTPAQIR